MNSEDHNRTEEHLVGLSDGQLRMSSRMAYISLKIGEGTHSDAMTVYPTQIRCFAPSEELHRQITAMSLDITPIERDLPRDEHWFRIGINSPDQVIQNSVLFKQLIEASIGIVRHRKEGLKTANG